LAIVQQNAAGVTRNAAFLTRVMTRYSLHRRP